MGTFSVEIKTDNAAFDGPDCGPELARILRKLADQVTDMDAEGIAWGGLHTLLDINGNAVGGATLKDA